MNSLLRPAIALSFLLVTGAASAGSSVLGFVAGDAAAPCQAQAALTGLDARVVAKAAQGVGSLRDYIFVTRGIYGLDMTDTVAWLDYQRAARATCVAEAATGNGRGNGS